MRIETSEDFLGPYSHQKCIILIDSKEQKTVNAKPQLYDLMEQGEKGDHPNMIYLGWGECNSVFVRVTRRTIDLIGVGHFWKNKR